jgi:hypothetical protein
MKIPRIAQTFLLVITLSLAGCGTPKSANPGYQIRGNQVYYVYKKDHVVPGVLGWESMAEFLIEGADGNTFQILQQDYAKDAKHLFYRGTLIPNSDSGTFQSLNDPSGLYAKNGRQVYARGVVIADADPATFEVTKYNGIARDKRDYYLDGTPLRIQDMNSFKLVGKACAECIWAYDHKNYYVGTNYGEITFPIADVPTFQVINQFYAKDAKQVYYLKEILAKADSATFQVLKDGYAKDGTRVYHLNFVMPDANIDTFQVLSYGYAKDAQHAYYGRSDLDYLNVDLPTFQVVGPGNAPDMGYAKDAKQVYYGGAVVLNADAATFVADENRARDKNRVYFGGQPGQELPKDKI